MVFENIEFYNVAEIIKKETWFEIIRIPEKLKNKLNENLKLRASMAAGCELRFKLKSKKAKIILSAVDNSSFNGICEVYFGNFFGNWYFIDRKPNPIEIQISIPENIDKLVKIAKETKLPFDPNLVRIVLPHLISLKILKIEGEFLPPGEQQTPQIKYLAYGSSITHGEESIIPTGTYTMRIAQILGIDVINLGFGAGAHLEKEMADYIVERNDWDFAIMELGINMVLDFEPDEFKRRVDYFIEKVASVNKYIFCIDIFPFYMDFENGEKQEKFRSIVKDKVKQLNNKKIVYVSGFDVLKDTKGFLLDVVHPSPYGMTEISYNLAEIIKNKIYKELL